jgi:hypothetical protein
VGDSFKLVPSLFQYIKNAARTTPSLTIDSESLQADHTGAASFGQMSLTAVDGPGQAGRRDHVNSESFNPETVTALKMIYSM